MPFLVLAPEVIEGGIIAVEGAEEAYAAYRAYRAAQAAARLAQAAARSGKLVDAATGDPCPECKKQKDPCEHLKKGNGPGDYRGGSHSEMSKPVGDGLDSNHTPAGQALEDTGVMSRADGAAVQMLPADHKLTKSWGSSTAAQNYRANQADLIDQGKYMEAFNNDAADVKDIARRQGDPTRYDEAIKEARAYALCREQHMNKG